MIDLATRDGTIAETGEQLQQHREMFNANANLQSMLRNPGVLAERKTNLLAGILDRTQPGLLVRNFILLLLKNDRLHHFDLICNHYDRMANEKLGRLTAHVTTAVELGADQYQAIEQRVAAVTHKTVQLDTRIDPSILGGVIVRIDNTVLDGSLRGRLHRLRRELVGG
jgi:F-type H+-transporting ATPase subunit delta